MISIIRTRMMLRREDIGKYVLGFLYEEGELYFLTPVGKNGKHGIWRNGLDRKKWFHESFEVFQSYRDAYNKPKHVKSHSVGLKIFSIAVYEEDKTICLEAEFPYGMYWSRS